MFIIKYLFLSTIFIISLFSNVELNLPNEVIKGERLVFSLSVSGNDIVMPDLTLINSSGVQEISSSTSTNIINSQITRIIKKIYSLSPSEDFIFPSLKFIVDGKEYLTKEKKILIKNPSKTISPSFDLSLIADKNDLYVSENFVLTLIFKHKKDANIIELSFDKPNFDNFWYKQLNDSKQYDEGDYSVQELKFLLFPLKEGLLKINPLKINAQVIDENNSYTLFSTTTKYIKIYSNELEFNVKKLPSNVNLIGDFEIKTSVDKTKIKQGEAVSFKIEIKGEGNVDDIKDFKLDLNDATIYENKPVIKTVFEDGKYKGTYTKVFSIIPNNSLIIPKIKLEYFNKKTSTVLIKQSDEIKLEVQANKIVKTQELLQKPKVEIKSKEVIKIIEKTSIKDRLIFFALGIIVAILILGLYYYVIKYRLKNKSNDTPLLKRVKRAKTKDELLKILAVYIKIDSALDELIFTLEEKNDIKLIKKDIIKEIKKINL